MRRKLVPLARRHAVQAEVAVVVDRTVHRAALILMYVGSDKGRLGRPHRSGEHPRDTNRAVLAHEQTVALPLVLFQYVNAKELHHAQPGVHGALETPRLLARHHHRSGAHANILCHAGSLHGVPDVREVVRLRTLLPVVAERRDDAKTVEGTLRRRSTTVRHRPRRQERRFLTAYSEAAIHAAYIQPCQSRCFHVLYNAVNQPHSLLRRLHLLVREHYIRTVPTTSRHYFSHGLLNQLLLESP